MFLIASVEHKERRPLRPSSNALISVRYKTGIVEFAQTLTKEFGVAVISTGRNRKILEEAGVPVVLLSLIPDFRDDGGRVKTLHPRVHGGLCAVEIIGHVADAGIMALA